MAKQIINIGSSANKGDGEPLRTAFDKINDNFNELYLKVDNLTGGVGVTVGDIKGSVFADDSTVLVDAVNGNIPGYIKLDVLKTEVAASADFAASKLRIAALT